MQGGDTVRYDGGDRVPLIRKFHPTPTRQFFHVIGNQLILCQVATVAADYSEINSQSYLGLLPGVRGAECDGRAIEEWKWIEIKGFDWRIKGVLIRLMKPNSLQLYLYQVNTTINNSMERKINAGNNSDIRRQGSGIVRWVVADAH